MVLAEQAKKLLWRINKAIAKDLLPTEPQDLRLEAWWVAHVVNLGKTFSSVCLPADISNCLL